MLAWKLWRPPGRNVRLSWVLWAAGWCLALGLVAAAALPAYAVTAWHLVFVGGYGLLTLAIATRVVVSHGGHEMPEEGRVLGAGVLVAAAIALVLRLSSDGGSPAALRLDALAAAAWAVAWGWWFAGAWPRVRRTKRRMLMPALPKRPGTR